MMETHSGNPDLVIVVIGRVRNRMIPSMATIPDTRYQRPIDTDTESDVLGMLYSSVNGAPQTICPSSDSLVFVMRASRHEVGGS